ncbi:hypothetical protein DM01DRAFT_1335097 [Hesseltinella vesiculosa]|uniref:DH domain-containing protein n=1 Tax=Hesseltinella vesiculosa TaxID=101127 RepID=A0A1X2GLE6_9FUNG|nr:hypothetical protein DM01DRAFT_1335097 [Hesseltinella vesiculosa]
MAYEHQYHALDEPPSGGKQLRIGQLEKAIREQQFLLEQTSAIRANPSHDLDYLKRRIVELSQQIKDQQDNAISTNGYTARQWWSRFQTNKRQLEDLAQQRRSSLKEMDYLQTSIASLTTSLDDENNLWFRTQTDYRKHQQQVRTTSTSTSTSSLAATEEERLRSRAHAMVTARLNRSKSHAQLSLDAQELDQQHQAFKDQLQRIERQINDCQQDMSRLLHSSSFELDNGLDTDDKRWKDQQMFERGLYVHDDLARFIDDLPTTMSSANGPAPSSSSNRLSQSSMSKLQRRASYRRSLLTSPTTMVDMDSFIPPPIPTTDRPESPRSTADIRAEAQRRIEARRQQLSIPPSVMSSATQPSSSSTSQPPQPSSRLPLHAQDTYTDEEKAAQERFKQAEAEARQRLLDMRERREQAREKARKEQEQRKKAAEEAQHKAEQDLLDEKKRQEEAARECQEQARKEQEALAARQLQLEQQAQLEQERQQAKEDEERQRKARLAAQKAAQEKRRQRQAQATREKEAEQAAADALQRRQAFEQAILDSPSLTHAAPPSPPATVAAAPSPATMTPEASSESFAATNATAGTSGYGIDIEDEVDFGTIYRAKALYSYQGVREDDLTLVEDEELKAHPSKDSNSDWWYGTSLSTGAAGFFPRTYVEVVEKAFHVQTLYPFEKTREDDMVFGENEVLLVQPFQDDNGDWWYGTNEDTGESGYFPKTYVEVIDAANVAATMPTIVESAMEESPVSIESPPPTVPAKSLSPTQLATPAKDDRFHIPTGGGVSAPSTPVMKKNSLDVEKQDISRRRRAASNASTLSTGQASNLSITIMESSRPVSPSLATTWASTMDAIELQAIPTEERQRQEAIYELIVTEKSYLRDLQMIVNVFFVDSSKYLQPNEQDVIFSNIDDLLLCNTALLSDLEKRQRECANVIDCVGDIFLQHAESLNCYSSFCRNQSFASRFLQKKRSEDQWFDVFLKTAQSRPECRSLDLSHFLLQPVQRITRYPLLLKQILKSTPKRHPDYGLVKSALSKSSRVLDDVNEETRRFENRQKMSELSRILDMEGYGRLDAPGREYVMDGVLHKAKSGRKLQGYLFSDMFLLLEPLKGLSPKGYLYGLYREPMSIDRLTIRDLPTSTLRTSFNSPDETGIQLGYDNMVLALKTSSTSQKKQWISQIQHYSAVKSTM